MMCIAFGITEEDIESVLDNYRLRILDAKGMSIPALAADIFNEIDQGRIENAALNSGTDMDAQTSGAHDEIKTILVEMGVLEF